MVYRVEGFGVGLRGFRTCLGVRVWNLEFRVEGLGKV